MAIFCGTVVFCNKNTKKYIQCKETKTASICSAICWSNQKAHMECWWEKHHESAIFATFLGKWTVCFSGNGNLMLSIGTGNHLEASKPFYCVTNCPTWWKTDYTPRRFRACSWANIGTKGRSGQKMYFKISFSNTQSVVMSFLQTYGHCITTPCCAYRRHCSKVLHSQRRMFLG